MNVLIIEDEVRIASFLTKGLAANGHAVQWKTTGREALDVTVAAPSRFEVILLDLGLPDIDGLDVLRALRTAASTATVIVITARNDDASRADAYALGAAGYFTKPFSFANLLALLREHGGANRRG